MLSAFHGLECFLKGLALEFIHRDGCFVHGVQHLRLKDRLLFLVFLCVSGRYRKGARWNIDQRVLGALPDPHVVQHLVKLLIRQLVLLPRCLLEDLFVHETVRFHVHSFDPVDHGDFVDDSLRGQLGSSLGVLLLGGVASGEPQFVNFTDTAKPMFLLDSDLSAFVPTHVLHALPETFRPGNVADKELDCALSVLGTRIKDSLVVEVGDVLDLAKPAKHRLALSISHLLPHKCD